MNGDKSKGKVLYISSRFPALSMTFVANEMNGIQEQGYDVSVCTIWDPIPGHKGHPAEIPFLDKVVTTNLKSFKNWALILKTLLTKPSILILFAQLVPGHLKSPWLFAKLLVALPKGIIAGRWVKDNQIIWIHAHFITTPTTVALIASKISGVGYTATAHAFDITSTNPKIVNGSVPIKCKNAAAIITISKYNKIDMLTRWPELEHIRLEVIYNGIDTSAFSPQPHSIANNKNNKVSILGVSNLNEKKGFKYLIEAVSILINRGHQAKLNIYGEGPERANLEAQIQALGKSESIVLHGSATQDQVASLCASTDIFALASIPLPSGDADGLPTVLIESLAAEVPTVSTQVTGIPEIIIDGETGKCVPAADADALADALEWIILNPVKSKEMAKKGRELVLTEFDRTIATTRIDKLWQELNGFINAPQNK